jgi:predicted ATPase
VRDLPTGTVTFLFTDVEGSTRLLEELVEGYADALAEHRLVLHNTCIARGGVLVDTQGDATFYAFTSVGAALAAAGEAQRALAIPVRMGVHTGEPQITGTGYVGIDVHRAARVCAAAHGGQVLVSETTARLADGDLRELGVYRLKDVGDIRLYQAGEGSFPPPRTLSATNLPLPSTPLLGRKKELADVLKLIGGGARLVTVTGPGGIGKTRFALEVAAEHVGRLLHGVWFVDLSALRDPDLVAGTIAATLGAKLELAEHIADKELLLCLDNFEQVVKAAPQLAGVLERCPNLRLLVTSREPLHLRGEREYPLRPLAEAPAVELFRQRARAIEPDFDAGYGELADVCRRLDQLPLAIELAAARTRTLTAEQLLDRLGERLPLLTSRARDLPERQRTLRATIEWSYDLLSPEEQELFRRLSVFAGGFMVEAAEAIADADLDSLESLVEKSLVRREGERFTMLETIRAYAAERLVAADGADAIRRRHAERFLELAETSARELRHSDLDSAMALERLDKESDNLRAALTWSCEAGEGKLALQLCAAVWRFWFLRGWMLEGRRLSEQALATGADQPDELKGRPLLGLASFRYYQGDLDESRALLEQAVTILHDADDVEHELDALLYLGHNYRDAGDLGRSAAAWEQATKLALETGRGGRLGYIPQFEAGPHSRTAKTTTPRSS